MRKGDQQLTLGDTFRGSLVDRAIARADGTGLEEGLSRRQFFKRVGQSGAVVAFLSPCGVGMEAALRGLFGRGLLPAVWADAVVWADGDALLATKPHMTVHNDLPINGEFAAHLLDDHVTPAARHFVRNNGAVPARAKNKNPQGWKLVVDGEVDTPLELTLDELKQLPAVRQQVVLECGGNGRALFEPKVRGNQWGHGAVACSEWTGVRLRNVLEKAGLKSSAVYTAHYGEDQPLGKAQPFSRGLPIAKAMDEHTLIAYQMNGDDLPALNGYPVRLIVPGWIGSCSQKWLNRIWVRDQVHDSQKMSGYSYRVPAYPVEPGTKPSKADMVIATAWRIKSLISSPQANAQFLTEKSIKVRGHAWAGEETVTQVQVSTDFGIHWKKAKLMQPANPYAWAHWETEMSFSEKGYYEVWARAFDDKGNAQPFRQPWNPKGYLGNVVHRVPVMITA